MKLSHYIVDGYSPIREGEAALAAVLFSKSVPLSLLDYFAPAICCRIHRRPTKDACDFGKERLRDSVKNGTFSACRSLGEYAMAHIPEPEDPTYFLEQAESCHRLARLVGDRALSMDFEKLAAEHELRAAELQSMMRLAS
jgi:hypothetical protein